VFNARAILSRYARTLWRRRWWGLSVAWVICIVGWAYVMHLPDLYQAKTRVYVDTDSMLRPLMSGIAFDPNLLSQVDVMHRTFLSTPNLQKVSHLTDLDLAAHTSAESAAVVEDLKQHVSIESQGDNLFSIAYTGPNRDTATKIVQSLLNVFVESNLGNTRQDIANAQSFIDQQLQSYDKQLNDLDKKIADFKAANLGALPGDSSYASKLEMAREKLTATQDELSENQQKRQAIADELASVPQLVDSYSSGPDQDSGFGPPLGPPLASGGSNSKGDPVIPTTIDAQERVTLLQRRLDALLADYTDQYPDVVTVKRQLEDAKARLATTKKTEKASGPNTPPTGPGTRHSMMPNPVYQQLQLQLASLDANIASLQSRVQVETASVSKWDGLAKSVPELGAELAKLTRDHDVIKKSYDDLLSRRESAKIGSDMATQTQPVQFRIIDPPAAPPAPVAPKRGLLLSAVLVGGILAGGALAFLLSQIDDAVITIRELRELAAIPVLGSIRRVKTAGVSKRQLFGVGGFATLTIALVVAFLSLLSLEGLVSGKLWS
jgi:polysaccharide chain length determinant protein (PEP-CTERM system associated)